MSESLQELEGRYEAPDNHYSPEPLQEAGSGLKEAFSFNGRLIWLDNARDSLLSQAGRDTLVDRYLLKGETFQRMFGRVACAGSDDDAHAQRLYDYISRLWFMPATPVLSNLGSKRGNPISCFLTTVEDSLEGIVDTWNENVWLAARGGGIGTYWGDVREIGHEVGENGKTSGIVPFIKVMDAQTLAISQGSLRRGSAAVYIPVSHPEINEFVELRRETGGDHNRRTLNLHNAVVIDDEFMRAVGDGSTYRLRSPADGRVVDKVDARTLWIKILTARIETGEPYLIFSDQINGQRPEHHKKLGLEVKQSNLCSEITLPTGRDYLGNMRSAVCCLSSLNLETYDEWRADEMIVQDVLRFLDNVLQLFIDRTAGVRGFERANYSARMERSIGLGVMGFHSYLQQRMIPFESIMAQQINKVMFRRLREKCDAANERLAHERGPCPDAVNAGDHSRRFSYMLAIAPTASISIIANDASPGIEPLAANAFTQKTLSGSLMIRNKSLAKLLESKGQDTPEVWSSIVINDGSVVHLEFLDEFEKDVFKTAIEIDQRWIVTHAADRTPYIDQSQSVNLFFRPDIQKKDLHEIHWTAWEKGLKTLYYCRSESLGVADKVSNRVERKKLDDPEPAAMYEVCEACM